MIGHATDSSGPVKTGCWGFYNYFKIGELCSRHIRLQKNKPRHSESRSGLQNDLIEPRRRHDQNVNTRDGSLAFGGPFARSEAALAMRGADGLGKRHVNSKVLR